MFSEVLEQVLPKAATLLATVFGSPIAGVVTDMGMNMLASKFGVPPKDVAALHQAIQNDPASSDKLGEIDDILVNFLQKQVANPKALSKFNLSINMEWDSTPISVATPES